jgi:hypothetical protein
VPAISLGTMLISYIWNQGIEPSRVTSVLYLSLHRNIWCICLAWITYECALGRGGNQRTNTLSESKSNILLTVGIVNKLLSSPIFVPLSRLSFGVYLVHLVVIYMKYFSQRSTIYWTHMGFVSHYSYD